MRSQPALGPYTRAVVLVVSSVVLLLGAIAVFARDALLDSDEAAELAVRAVEEPEVRSGLATTVVDQMIEYDQELLVVRPVLEIVVDGVLGSRTAKDIVRFGVADLHRTVFLGSADTLSIELTELILAARVSLAKLDPELAEAIPEDVVDGVISFQSSPALVRALRAAQIANVLAFVLPLTGLAGLAVYVWSATDRRGALVIVGLLGVVLGLAMIAVETAARTLTMQQFSADGGRPVAAAVWDVATGSYHTVAIFVAGAGAVLAAVTTLGRDRRDFRESAARMRRAIDAPASTRARIGWGAAGVVIGILFIADGERIVAVVMVGLGAVLIAVGLSEVVRAIAASSSGPSGATLTFERAPAAFRWTIGAIAVIGALALFVVAVSRSGGEDAAAGAGGPGCNGSVLLCHRPLDQVAFATTHNSMAAADDGFTGAYQTVGIVAQLDAGYRAFLVDSYFGIAADELVVTDRTPLSEEERARLVAGVGEASVRAAEGLRASLEAGGGQRDVYLCHSYCELGAVPMADEMSRVKEWLDDHPREVLLFVIQDEGPTVEDMKVVFEASDLLPHLHAQPPDEPWPTLAELIDSDRRVWVSAENAGGGEAWYHDAFTHVQDTPFSQPTTADFTCEILRGEPDNALFLVNHWLSPASPTAADEANSRAVLEARLDDCEAERDRFVNLLAVDFSDRGDVVAVVAELNRLGSP